MPEELAFDSFRADSTAGNGEAFELSQAPTDALRVFVDGELSEEWTVDQEAGVVEVADPPVDAQVAVIYRATTPPPDLPAVPPLEGPLPDPDDWAWEGSDVDAETYYAYRTAKEAKSANARDDLMTGLGIVILLLWAVAEIADEFL